MSRVDRGVCSVLGLDGAQRASLGGGLLAAAARTVPVALCGRLGGAAVLA